MLVLQFLFAYVLNDLIAWVAGVNRERVGERETGRKHGELVTPPVLSSFTPATQEWIEGMSEEKAFEQTTSTWDHPS